MGNIRVDNIVVTTRRRTVASKRGITVMTKRMRNTGDQSEGGHMITMRHTRTTTHDNRTLASKRMAAERSNMPLNGKVHIY